MRKKESLKEKRKRKKEKERSLLENAGETWHWYIQKIKVLLIFRKSRERMKHHAFSQGNQIFNEGEFLLYKSYCSQLMDEDGMAEWHASRSNNHFTENTGGRGMRDAMNKILSLGNSREQIAWFLQKQTVKKKERKTYRLKEIEETLTNCNGRLHLDPD